MTTDALIIKGDCLNVMAGLPDGSIDAIVTDPPYGLGFLGKNWDHSVPGEAFWREALRVAKPGCHLLAAGGSRTYHRLAVAIEDAGWEIRDCVMWLYGSGFPKSLDVSKAIDKARHEDIEPAARVARWLCDQLEKRGLSRRDVSSYFEAKNIAQQWTTHWTDGAVKPRVPRVEQWAELKAWLSLPDDMDAEVWRLNGNKGQPGENFKQREVVGQGSSAISTRKELQNNRGTVWGADSSTFDITAPATDAARQWQGWGTALKPAFEPFILARKPLDGTVAENVLTHGTGGINVDACRIAHNGEKLSGGGAQNDHNGWGKSLCGKTDSARSEALGRWPANVIHDGSDEVLAGFEGTEKYNRPGKGPRIKQSAHSTSQHLSGLDTAKTVCFDDSGSAARFFYCAKASRDDRSDGNHHPTVKPIDLMKYLCRLITPPGGLLLDPFCGSGSTGVAAIREGFNFIGIELNHDYAEIARRRIDHERNKTPLFSEVI